VAPTSLVPDTGLAERLGQTLARILPAEHGTRWPMLAAAAVLLVLALACALAILLGAGPRGGTATPAAIDTATLAVGVGSTPPAPGAIPTVGAQPSLPQATATPAAFQGRVVSTLPLALRQEPRLLGALVAYLNSGTTLTVLCRAAGDPVEGDDTWYRVTVEGSRSGYAAARWIGLQGAGRAAVPACED
jgi:hypothetical protein